MTSREHEDFLSESTFYELGFNTLDSKLGITKYAKTLIDNVQKIIEDNSHDYIHINTGSIFLTYCCVVAAQRAKARAIISHSHNTNPQNSRKRNKIANLFVSLSNMILRCQIRRKSDYLFACSLEAGEYLFGKRGIHSPNFHVVPNAIKTERFLFDAQVRKQLRENYLVEENTTVLGCVGRLSRQKNHAFLVEVFKEYHDKNENSVLWLIGEGEKRKAIEQLVAEYGLQKAVVFWGQRKDVNELLQAMDAFVLTSFFEGFGIVSLEAQAAGLTVFLPEEISHESAISQLVTFIPLRDGAEHWASVIEGRLANPKDRVNMYDVIRTSGYDIDAAAAALQRFYLGMPAEFPSRTRQTG